MPWTFNVTELYNRLRIRLNKQLKDNIWTDNQYRIRHSWNRDCKLINSQYLQLIHPKAIIPNTVPQ